MVIFTSTHYFVTLHWDGTLFDSLFYCTGTNGNGTLFTFGIVGKQYGWSGAMNGQIYIPSSVDSNGFGSSDSTITSYQSIVYTGVITNFGAVDSIPSTEVAIPIKQAPLSTVGLPSTLPLTLPLTQVFN